MHLLRIATQRRVYCKNDRGKRCKCSQIRRAVQQQQTHSGREAARPLPGGSVFFFLHVFGATSYLELSETALTVGLNNHFALASVHALLTLSAFCCRMLLLHAVGLKLCAMDYPTMKRHRPDTTCFKDYHESRECPSAGTGDAGDRTLPVERCGVAKERVVAKERIVEKMQAEVEAMKAARDGMPRPEGCSVKAFQEYATQCRNVDKFRACISEAQTRIDLKEQDIRDELRRIDLKEQDIRDELRRIDLKEQDIRDERRIDAMKALQAPAPQRFATATAACDAVKALEYKSSVMGFALSGQKWCNAGAIKKALFEGMQKLIEKSYLVACDKSVVPLMCVVGSSGQGKTDTLMHIRDDVPLQEEIAATVRAHAKHVRCKWCAALMATFNQDSTYSCDYEANVESALCNRLLSDYVGVHFDRSLTNRFNGISLSAVLELVRQEEATKRGCQASEVCVMVLVDELRKLGSKMSVLLDALCSVQQGDLGRGCLTFVVATCLDIESIFSVVTRNSQRPLHSIPLTPCSAPDMNDFVERCLKATPNLIDIREEHSKELLWRAHATGGHFRSLEHLWSHFVSNSVVPPLRNCVAVTSAYVLEIVARQLRSPGKLRMRESDKLGAVFGNGRDLQSLYDLAMSNFEGVFYNDIDIETLTVAPCVSPLCLRERLAYGEDSRVAQSIVNIWPCIFKQLTGQPLVKSWEVAVPLLEAVAATLIREVGGEGAAVRLEDVYHGAFVKSWLTTSDVLEYAVSCGDCMSIWKPLPAPKGEGVLLEDSQALAEACKSTKATLCVAGTANYPSIEGVHTLLEASGSPVPVVFQMKTQSTVTAANLETWAGAAHAHAQATLKLQKGSYYVALYLKVRLGDVRNWEPSIPNGTIVIDGGALERVLQPFGATPLLHL
jgi:hypothetical protein